MAEEGCAALWFQGVPEATGELVSGQVAEAQDGWCEVRDATIGGGHDVGSVVRAELIRWRAPGLRAFLQALRAPGSRDAPPPASFDLELEGARMAIETDDSTYDWLFDAQTVPSRFRGDLAAVWDPTARGDRRAARLDFAGDNAIRLEATVAEADLSGIAALQGTLGRAGVTRLWGEVTTQGLFENTLLMAVGPLVLDLRARVTPSWRSNPAAVLAEQASHAFSIRHLLRDHDVWRWRTPAGAIPIHPHPDLRSRTRSRGPRAARAFAFILSGSLGTAP
jgi:hypothetical protein